MILVVAKPLYGDGFPVVGGRGDASAVQSLEAFRVADGNVEAARDVPRHVRAAEGHRVDMDEPPAGEDPDRRRAAAKIDHRGAKLRFVVDERREARRIGRRHHRLNPQMAAFDDQHQIAGGRRITGGEMKIEAEFVADHALRVTHVLGRVRAGRRSEAHAGLSARAPHSPRRQLRAHGGCRVPRRSCRATSHPRRGGAKRAARRTY